MIDTLKKARPAKKSGQTEYDADYEACEGLITLAADFPGLAFIVAHHDRKMGADDVFDTVSGTLGLTGGVDTIAILKKSGSDVTLHIQGRDLVDEVQKAVRLDKETARWMVLGEAAEVHRSTQRTRVIDALRGAPGGLGVTEIMATAQLSKRDAADALLSRMFKDGEIERHGRGKYGLPGKAASEASENQNGQQAIEIPEESLYSDASDASDAGSA